ncbi:IclR family transcriptional regulator [Spirillospora sp. CA-294931]|uniref:IclR family transcriptional regulator n=1 Tax=Spirillospora sp. CA-294931 TaxID=3240042 RepID=UPI003D8F63C6
MPIDGTTDSTRGRGVLEGAFGLLEAVERSGSAGLTALAAASGLPKATAHRLLEQLVQLGALERAGAAYRIGPRLFQLGQEWQPHPGLRGAAREPMRGLATATGASVGITVLAQGRALIAGAVAGDLDAVVPLRPGSSFSWTTAAGKVLVAGSTAAAPLHSAPSGWARQAAAIRDRGVAIDMEEVVPGVCCIAVPVRGSGGKTVAAVCALVEPTQRLRPMTDALSRTASHISARLHPRHPATHVRSHRRATG